MNTIETITVNCKECGMLVVDGSDGTIYPPAPWEDCPSGICYGICYGCENAAEEEYDRHELEQLACAEDRCRGR